MKFAPRIFAGVVLALAFCATAFAQNAEPKNSVLITNANIFDGKSDKLATGMSVLVEGNKIAKIAKSITAPEGATTINANGRTLSPGFIAVHEHLVGQMPFGDIFTTDTRYAGYVATQTTRDYLMNGFTAVRDAAGNTFSLKLAIDRGYVVGPRIYPSGPMISQTSGHADHRHQSDTSVLIGGTWDPMVRHGDMAIVDGVPEVLKAVRENLRQGASQIKIAVGGGRAPMPIHLTLLNSRPRRFAPLPRLPVTGAPMSWPMSTTPTESGAQSIMA